MQRFLKKLPYIICYIIAFAFGMKQLREPDIWWQLLSGQWMLEHGQVTRTDTFSYTMAGHTWVNVKWLYEVLIAFLEKGFGPEGLMLLQCIINVGILWVLFHTLKHLKGKLQVQASNFFTIIAALLFFIVVEYRMTGRPEMISHFMCAFYIYYLWRFPALKWKQIAVLVALQCLWANMHEGYPIGIVILGTYTVGGFIAWLSQKDKAYQQIAYKAAALTALAIIAILLNPNGIQLWKQPFEIYRQVWANKYTTELYAYTDPQYWTIQAKIHIALMSVVIVFWIVRLWHAYKQKDKRFASPVMLCYLFLIPLFSYLSLTANRNIPFAEIIYFPTIPYMMWWLMNASKINSRQLYTTVARYGMSAAIVVSVVLYVSVVNNTYYKLTKSPNRFGIHTSILHNPGGAVDFIQRNNIKGPAFSDYFVSSYLLWAMYPDFKSFIDLRDLDIFPEKFFAQYFNLYENPKAFHALDEKYHFNYIVISTSQLPRLQHELYWGEGFNQVYADPVVAVYLKMTEENTRINNNFGLQKIFSWPQPAEDQPWANALNSLFNPSVVYENEDEINEPVYSAKYYNELGNYPLSIKQLRPAMYGLNEDAEANFVLGTSYLRYAGVVNEPKLKQEKIDSAGIYLKKSMELDPKRPGVYAGLANIFFMTGDYKKAIIQLDKSLALDNTDDYFYFLEGLSYRVLWKQGDAGSRDKMFDAMKHSARLNPANGRAYLYMAEACAAKNDNEQAKEYVQKAIKSGNAFVGEEGTLMAELKAKLGIK